MWNCEQVAHYKIAGSGQTKVKADFDMLEENSHVKCDDRFRCDVIFIALFTAGSHISSLMRCDTATPFSAVQGSVYIWLFAYTKGGHLLTQGQNFLQQEVNMHNDANMRGCV